MPDQGLTHGLRELVWSLESEVAQVSGLSRRIDEHVRTLNALRDELARRLGALDALQDSVADADLGHYLARVVQTPLPELAEHFPERLYG